MLLRGSSSRGSRGQSQNRSRGSRGRGSTSRGASSSSNSSTSSPNCSTRRDRGFKNKYSNNGRTGKSPSEEPSNPFEDERLENAAKREQKRQTGVVVNGRGGRGVSRGHNKQVRFAEIPTKEKIDFSTAPSAAPKNPFDTATKPTSSPFGTPAMSTFNPFAAKKDALANPFGAPVASSNPFGTAALTSNPFGAPSHAPVSTSAFGMPSSSSGATSTQTSKPKGLFGMPSGTPNGTPLTNAFGKPSTSVFGKPANTPATRTAANTFGMPSAEFGASSIPSSGPFSSPTTNTNGFLETKPKDPISQKKLNPFGASKTSTGIFGGAKGFVQAKPSKAITNGGLSKTSKNGNSCAKPFSQQSVQPLPTTNLENSSTALAQTISQILRKERIISPNWPQASPGDPSYKAGVEGYWRSSRDYRTKVRACLIRAGLLDDPDKPKKLSEAIDFKGICEDMCPDFERATRINERDWKAEETEVGLDGKSQVAPNRMVKALARSAAGQDAPLPMDVRSPAALRRTLDYLFQTVLGDGDENLPKVHNFLWDRTRAIRRDFVFQSSMNPTELLDQIYCLERITRFHAIALHQMSRNGLYPTEQFSEQQEVEQLGKALLSLIHTYDDCGVQGIMCKNETEFRAYYALFYSRSSGILQTVQDWGWKVFQQSNDIQIAVSLIETLQNIWDKRGPLKPDSATDVAANSYAKFFSIVEDKKVSYTMACFAEIHFNTVRKAILNTILTSYRKQRDQTKDWTLSKLNRYLRFDDEDEILAFGEAYGLRFDEIGGEDCLSFESESVSDPFPQLKQAHSYTLVERKLGNHSLPGAFDKTVFDESNDEDIIDAYVEEEEESLFVMDDSVNSQTDSLAPLSNSENTISNAVPPQVEQNISKSASLFDGFSSQKKFGSDFFTQKPTQQLPPVQATETPTSLIFAKPTNPSPSFPPSIFSKNPQAVQSNGIPTFPKQADVPSLFAQKPATSAPLGEAPKEATSIFGTPTTSSPDSGLSSAPLATQNTIREDPLKYAQEIGSSVSIPNQALEESNQSIGQQTLPSSTFTKAPVPNTTTPSLSSPGQTPQPTSSLQLSVSPDADSVTRATPEEQQLPNINQPSVVQKNPPRDRKSQLDNLASWVALGNDGLIDQFTSFNVEEILRQAAGIYLQEEAERIAKQAADLANSEADKFRRRSLSTKYLHLWREQAHRQRMKRRGREARQARREMAENYRALRATQSTHIVEDFKASTIARRRGSLESLLDATGVLDGVHDSEKEIRAIVQEKRQATGSKRPRSENPLSTHSSSTDRHKRGKSDNPLRRSLLSDPSWMNGGSRIHLLPKYDTQDKNHHHINGVQTDYFRLKARGVSALPNGSPAATLAAKNVLHQKRSFDGISKPSTLQQPKRSSIARSVPSHTEMQWQHFRTSEERDEDVRALKRKAQEAMPKDLLPWPKRNLEDEDQELFERAKRLREQMDEGLDWYRRERERHSGSRSVS